MSASKSDTFAKKIFYTVMKNLADRLCKVAAVLFIWTMMAVVFTKLSERSLVW